MKQIPLDKEKLQTLIPVVMKQEYMITILLNRYDMNEKELEQRIYSQALSIESSHKRYFRKSRNQIQTENRWEALLSLIATQLVAMLEIARIKKDIMLESDLERIALSDLNQQETYMSLKQAIELVAMMI